MGSSVDICQSNADLLLNSPATGILLLEHKTRRSVNPWAAFENVKCSISCRVKNLKQLLKCFCAREKTSLGTALQLHMWVGFIERPGISISQDAEFTLQPHNTWQSTTKWSQIMVWILRELHRLNFSLSLTWSWHPGYPAHLKMVQNKYNRGHILFPFLGILGWFIYPWRRKRLIFLRGTASSTLLWRRVSICCIEDAGTN